jgi:hypothetical protein
LVSAKIETVDAVLDRVGGRQHQHPRARPPRDKRAADVVAVEPGQVAVEQDHVVAVADGVPQGVLAVEDDVHGHPLTAEPDRDRRGELLVVLDDEHAHPGSLLAAQGCPTSGYTQVTAPVPPL